MSDALVHRADDDRIAVITLDSPANRNALSRRLIAELTDHLAQAVKELAGSLPNIGTLNLTLDVLSPLITALTGRGATPEA